MNACLSFVWERVKKAARFAFPKPLLITQSITLCALIAAFLFLPEQASAQSLSLNLGDGSGSFTGRLLQFIIIITVISIAPSLLLMVTSFTRFIVVFSFLRSALGMQNSPPNQVLIALAFFMTLFIMAPTFEAAYENGMKPLIEEKINEETAFAEMAKPFHAFMLKHVRENDVALFSSISGQSTYDTPADIPLKVLVPSFMIGELKRAFEIGFLIFLPFLIIDMVVASVLMSMGMMMLPPVMIALPFKIIFFVLVDGWNLVVGSLVRGFG